MLYNVIVQKSGLFFAITLVLFTCSCERDNPVKQYGTKTIESYERAQQVGQRVNIQQIQDSLKAFHASNGRYPNDLEEAEGFTGVKLDPDRYDYNPATGIITAKKLP